MKVVLSPSNPDFPVEILMPRGFSTKLCKVLLPVSLVVHNALGGVGECCETVHEFLVRILCSTEVLCSSNTNVNTNVISCSWKLKSFYSSSSCSYSSMLQVAINKLRYIIQSFLVVRSVVSSDVSLVGLMIVLFFFST